MIAIVSYTALVTLLHYVAFSSVMLTMPSKICSGSYITSIWLIHCQVYTVPFVLIMLSSWTQEVYIYIYIAIYNSSKITVPQRIIIYYNIVLIGIKDNL